MKVIMINGSPKANGNTAYALSVIASELAADGIDSEIVDLGTDAYRDCISCGKCKTDRKCVFDDDVVNELIDKITQADALIVGTPVYYAHPSGRIITVLDRVFYAGSRGFAHKPGAVVAVARRAGTTASVDVLNKYFTIAEMPLVSSTYWNVVYGRVPGEAELDAEGMQTMRNLAHNMSWMLKCIEAGRACGIEAPVSERKSYMNFIR